MEPSGGESGNIEHAWGMYNKPAGCSTPAYGASHKQTNKVPLPLIMFNIGSFNSVY
jgi:hypothetical protein